MNDTASEPISRGFIITFEGGAGVGGGGGDGRHKSVLCKFNGLQRTIPFIAIAWDKIDVKKHAHTHTHISIDFKVTIVK